jgi:hypothetical protein
MALPARLVYASIHDTYQILSINGSGPWNRTRLQGLTVLRLHRVCLTGIKELILTCYIGVLTVHQLH